MRPNGDRGDSSLNRVEEALYGVVLESTATDGVVTEQQGQQGRRLRPPPVRPGRQRHHASRLLAEASRLGRTSVREITVALIEDDICAPTRPPALADALFEVIKANRSRIARPGRATPRR